MNVRKFCFTFLNLKTLSLRHFNIFNAPRLKNLIGLNIVKKDTFLQFFKYFGFLSNNNIEFYIENIC